MSRNLYDSASTLKAIYKWPKSKLSAKTEDYFLCTQNYIYFIFQLAQGIQYVSLLSFTPVKISRTIFYGLVRFFCNLKTSNFFI